MKFNQIRNQLNLCQDLINIFTDYSFGLDDYFKNEVNQKEHSVLYNEYLLLNENIKHAIKKNGFDKR